MTRLVFINRFFWPDQSATSQILSDLAVHLAATGRDIHVITSRLRYQAASGHLPLAAHEQHLGVNIHRVATTSFGRAGLLGRSADYASFYAAAWSKAMALVGPGDVLVAMTDPPLLSILAADVARRRSAMLVNWTQDLYPEIALNLGVRGLRGPQARFLMGLRDWSFKAARANVAIGSLMAERKRAMGVEPSTIVVIPNWVPGHEIDPVPHADNPLRTAWGLQDTFVVGYSGNLGRAHEVRTLLDAAERLADEPAIRFLIVGGGHHMAAAAEESNRRGLAHRFVFKPYQDQDQLALSLSLPDVHWVSLRPEFEGLIVPSKIFGIAAVGRPVIAIVDPEGEVGRLVLSHGCGITVQPGDAAGLAAAIRHLKDDPAHCLELGARARRMHEAEFHRRHALARWQALLAGIGADAEPQPRTTPTM
jgi:glycosyltransferase involved in cell wall biosynthesis